jgi:hypothetical protein
MPTVPRVSARGSVRKVRDGRLPRALPSALPAWRTYLLPCWMLCFNCSAIAVPRDGRCSHRTGRCYVPTNEEKTRCVDSISSFQDFRHLSFRLEGLCNGIVPGRSAIPDSWSHSRKNRRIFAHFHIVSQPTPAGHLPCQQSSAARR